MSAPRKWIRREYQKVALVAVRQTRILGLFWARQCRKSTTLGDIAFDEMSREPGRNVIAASASLLLGTELVSKAVTATEQAVIVGREAAAMRAAMEHSAADSRAKIQLVAANAETGAVYDGLTPDDFTDLYKSGRLEMRLMFDRTAYSRLRVIAPNPATARGWTGTVLRDEIGFIRNEAEVQAAVKPIIDTDPTFKMIYASNLPNDDAHPWFAMTMPADPSLTFAPNASGHFYRGSTGIRIHRVDIADAYAAGHVLYNDDGKAQTLPEFLAGEPNKSMLRGNYTLVHEFGGAAAVNSLSFHTAQQRGVGQCACIMADDDLDFQKALAWLRDHLQPGLPTGLGWDVATTENKLSNPSSVTVAQRSGVELRQPLVVLWKTRDPKLARARARAIIEACRDLGAPGRRLCIDGSNERNFAEETRQEFASLIPVEIVVSGEVVEPFPAGYDRNKGNVNYKTYLGDQYAGEINDNHYVCPPEAYYKKDHQSVIKERGKYSCEVAADGGHGDTFDSGKLAQFAINGNTANYTAILIGGEENSW